MVEVCFLLCTYYNLCDFLFSTEIEIIQENDIDEQIDRKELELIQIIEGEWRIHVSVN